MPTRYYNRRKKKKNWLYEILTIIASVLLICCAYAGAVNPQSFFPAPFMALAFIPMLLLVLVLLVGAFIWRRWWSALIILVAVAATLPVLKLFVGMNSSENRPPVPADPKLMLKVMTYNVLGFNYQDPELCAKPSATMKLILDADPDVVLLQEGTARDLDWSQVPSLKPYIGEIKTRYPYCYHSSEGLSMMSKYLFTTQTVGDAWHSRSPLGFTRGQSGHLARAYDLQLPSGKQLRLIDFRLQSYHLSFGKNPNIRVSPDVKPSPLERMRRSFVLRGENASVIRKAIDASPANLIVCGDMNDIAASHVYRTISGDDLHDAWCEVGTGYASTYNSHSLYYRIDHVLYRGDLHALYAKRLKGGSSDHYPLMVTFDIDVTDRGN